MLCELEYFLVTQESVITDEAVKWIYQGWRGYGELYMTLTVSSRYAVQTVLHFVACVSGHDAVYTFMMNNIYWSWIGLPSVSDTHSSKIFILSPFLNPKSSGCTASYGKRLITILPKLCSKRGNRERYRHVRYCTIAIGTHLILILQRDPKQGKHLHQTTVNLMMTKPTKSDCIRKLTGHTIF